MRLLAELRHPEVPEQPAPLLQRRAARGIVLREDRLLLLFTERYNDFSLPGGGVDEGEALDVALARELEEETGARNVRVIEPFGRIDELRPHWQPGFPFMAMQSYVYRCDIDAELGPARMEAYEQAAGMRPEWVRVVDAIAHNRDVVARGDAAMGLSIQREILLLERVQAELIEGRQAA